MTIQNAIFYLTDFGLTDPWVGIMKAVAMTNGHTGPQIDLTHGIPPQDVLAAAVVLDDWLEWVPRDSVVVAVVDPGVGSNRRAIAVRLRHRIVVAPDNGLVTLLLDRGAAVREILPGGPIQPQASATFHGRDVFAPAAALLATGRAPYDRIGPVVQNPIRLAIPTPVVATGGNVLRLTALLADHFGNVAMNLTAGTTTPLHVAVATFWAGKRCLGPLRRTFSDVPRGEPVVYWNSTARLEVGVNGGSALIDLGIRPGDEIRAVLEGHDATNL